MKRKFTTLLFLILATVVLFSVLVGNGNRKAVTDSSILTNDFSAGTRGQNIKGHNRVSSITDDTDFAWDNIGAGKDYYANGQYGQAAEAFRRAYSAKFGSKPVAGLNLARCYEKLSRYDEGIALIDQMIKGGELSQKGIQNANEIKSRLVASKDKANEG